jgi:hypothetical protein
LAGQVADDDVAGDHQQPGQFRHLVPGDRTRSPRNALGGRGDRREQVAVVVDRQSAVVVPDADVDRARALQFT